MEFNASAIGRHVSLIILGALLSACSNDDGGAPVTHNPFQEVVDQGLANYLGAFTPSEVDEVDGITSYKFDPQDGPICVHGSDYTMSTFDQGGDELVIFLQGGGACWSDFCLPIETAPPGIPQIGLLDPMLGDNPARNANVAYFPYCDGSLFAGDGDFDDNGDGTTDRYNRGLLNLSAGLDVTAKTFPNPKRVILSGSSGGAFGTITALMLVRTIYPDTPIELINDSGVGVAKAAQPNFTRELIEEWNADILVPDSCTNCYDNGHLTTLIDWQLKADDNVRMGFITSKHDTVIATIFLQIGGPAFEEAVIAELEKLGAAHPDRFKSFISNGNSHTVLLGDISSVIGDISLPPGLDLETLVLLGDFDTSAQGIRVGDWITDMLEGSEDWQSVLAE